MVEGWGGSHPKIWPNPYVFYKKSKKKKRKKPTQLRPAPP
jgi:hypothetical protein